MNSFIIINFNKFLQNFMDLLYNIKRVKITFQVVTTFELPGCEDMWTVIGPVNDELDKSETDGVHAFLILSHEDSTMVTLNFFYLYYILFYYVFIQYFIYFIYLIDSSNRTGN